MDDRPIGVFDSGIGGLTVVREIVRALPGESLVFLGDTARVPYGTRGADVIRAFAMELGESLLRRDVKYLVAACNTISSTCLDQIAERLPVPLLGVVDPVVGAAVQKTTKGRVGVIGTRATIGSGFYQAQIKRLNPNISVFSQACPLFVPLAEEGLLDGPATRLIAEEYLESLRNKDIDLLILGCTHYPLLQSVIRAVIGDEVEIIDSARPTAADLATKLAAAELLAGGGVPTYDLLVTDAPERVEQVACLFFGEPLPARLQKTNLA